MAAREDEASAQLQTDLRQAIVNTYSIQRPILTHLNADTTWLLSLPYPRPHRRPPGRCRFNVLIDPWLQGPQTDVASWFSTQWHVTKSSVESITELDQLLRTNEGLELQLTGSCEQNDLDSPLKSLVDLVVVSHEFSDHCHQNTLMEVDPSTPVVATTKAADLIRSWSHFTTVVTMPVFREGCDWHTTSITPLPPWLGISRLVTAANALYFHSAVIICIQLSQSEKAEAIAYTPHGIHAETTSTLKSAEPALDILALLHGLHDVSISRTKQLNLGAHNALKAQRLLQAKYWVSTHDEVKKSAGIIAPFLKRQAYTLLDALSFESKVTNTITESTIQGLPPISYSDLGNGESLLLR